MCAAGFYVKTNSIFPPHDSKIPQTLAKSSQRGKKTVTSTNKQTFCPFPQLTCNPYNGPFLFLPSTRSSWNCGGFRKRPTDENCLVLEQPQESLDPEDVDPVTHDAHSGLLESPECGVVETGGFEEHTPQSTQSKLHPERTPREASTCRQQRGSFTHLDETCWSKQTNKYKEFPPQVCSSSSSCSFAIMQSFADCPVPVKTARFFLL